jgi:hypothetical protein
LREELRSETEVDFDVEGSVTLMAGAKLVDEEAELISESVFVASLQSMFEGACFILVMYMLARLKARDVVPGATTSLRAISNGLLDDFENLVYPFLELLSRVRVGTMSESV